MSQEALSVSGQIATPLSPGELAAMIPSGEITAEVGPYTLRTFVSGRRVEWDRIDDGYLLAGGLDGEECALATPLSQRLSELGIRHRFEIYEEDRLTGYLNHDWPAREGLSRRSDASLKVTNRRWIRLSCPTVLRRWRII